MQGLTAAAWTCVVLLLLACSNGAAPETFESGRLGRVELFRPAAAPAAVVFLLSDEAGWSPAWESAALALRADGAAVVGIDLAAYLSALRASDDGCHYVVSELEALSKRVQRELGSEQYLSPILAGAGAGGAFAYAALAQAPAATLAGAVSVDPTAALATRVPLCPGAPASPAPDGGFAYGRALALPGFWRVDPGSALAPELEPLAQRGATAADGASSAERVVALLEPLFAGAADAIVAADRHDLPLAVIPADHPGPWMAVIWSGDGGWRDIDKQVGEILAREGAPVVGVDSLRYFWRRRTPEQVARDLAAVLSHYSDVWGTRRVVLIGYSFGAGILPFAVNRLPPDARARILQISLLGLEPRAAFEFHVEGWFGRASAEDLPVLPELQRIDLGLLQCFYGEQEPETLCRAPELAGAEKIVTSGGHHFDGDYAALARRIAEGAQRRLGGTP
ncbi:virulence factor family protein [Myxococcota bacterium]|nr:virulence factor family protein [Myxococcota bacterium]